MIAIIIILLITLHALEHGFRLKKDMNPKHKNFKLYDELFHWFSLFHIALWILTVYLAGTSGLFISQEYWRLVLAFILLRFGVFDLILNICNLDNRPINYLRITHWSYKLADNVLHKHDTKSLIWYTKVMVMISVLIWLIFN